MAREQMIWAFIAALVNEGVDAQVVERAVARACDNARLGASITEDNPLARAFAVEQTHLLERAYG